MESNLSSVHRQPLIDCPPRNLIQNHYNQFSSKLEKTKHTKQGSKTHDNIDMVQAEGAGDTVECLTTKVSNTSVFI